MSSAVELHSQIASIMEVLANSAVAEICKAVEDGYAVVNLEVSRSLKENECLRRRVRLLELQVSRYRAEQRLRTPLEGATSGRVFPGVRLLRHGTGRDTPTGFSLQGRNRAVNRSFVSQPQQKTPPMDLDQDPDQDVVTTTKTEPTESEEDSDLVIVKVEGSVSVESPGVSGNSSLTPSATTSDSQAQTVVQTEGQEPQENPTSFWKSEVEEDEGDFKTSPPAEEQSPFIPNWQDGNPKPSISAHQLIDCPTSPNLDPLHTAPTSFSLQNDSQEVYASSHHILNPHFRPEDFTPAILSAESNGLQNFPFSCALCHQVFAQKSHLRAHRKVHMVEKPYKCDQCGKMFDSFGHLKRHKQVHTGERPHLCTQCGKHFSTANNLKVHQSVHTGDRRFKCETCGKTYTFHSNLIRHQAVHVK